MTVLANAEIIWVFIIISVIVQVIKFLKKVASQAQGKNTGADGGAGAGGKGGQKPEFVAPDEALQEFLRTLGGGQNPAARPTAPKPVQVISATRGISQPQAQARRRMHLQAISQPIPVTPRYEPAHATPAYAQSVQEAVVLEKYPSDKATAASIFIDAIRKDLSDAEAIRKAIVLREVLGPPIALR